MQSNITCTVRSRIARLGRASVVALVSRKSHVSSVSWCVKRIGSCIASFRDIHDDLVWCLGSGACSSKHGAGVAWHAWRAWRHSLRTIRDVIQPCTLAAALSLLKVSLTCIAWHRQQAMHTATCLVSMDDHDSVYTAQAEARRHRCDYLLRNVNLTAWYHRIRQTALGAGHSTPHTRLTLAATHDRQCQLPICYLLRSPAAARNSDLAPSLPSLVRSVGTQ